MRGPVVEWRIVRGGFRRGVGRRNAAASAVVAVDAVDLGECEGEGYCGSTESQPSSPHIQPPVREIWEWFQTNSRGVEVLSIRSSSCRDEAKSGCYLICEIRDR